MRTLVASVVLALLSVPIVEAQIRPGVAASISREFQRISGAQDPAVPPGLDWTGADGPTFPINITETEGTYITTRWSPRIENVQAGGRLAKVGHITEFRIADCEPFTGVFEWEVFRDAAGEAARMLDQQGGCTMRVRWLRGGPSEIRFRYAYYTGDNAQRRTIERSAAPLPVEVDSGNWLEQLGRFMRSDPRGRLLTGVAVVGGGLTLYCRSDSAKYC